MVMEMTENYARLVDDTVVEIICLPEEMALEDIFTPEIAETLMQTPDHVGQGWKWQDGQWQEPRLPVPPTLEEIKRNLKAAIDSAAETERLKYITPGAGQAMTYQEKVAQAVSYTKAHLAYVAGLEGMEDGEEGAGEPNMAEYPLLAAGLGIDGDTLLEVAETVTFAYAIWQQIGAAIEAMRLLAKANIDAAGSVEEAQSLFNAVVWPNPQMLDEVGTEEEDGEEETSSEAVAATARAQLPSLNWQKDWQPAGLKARLERDCPPLFKARQGLIEEERQRLRQMMADCQAALTLQPTPEQMNGLLSSLFSALQSPNKAQGGKAVMDTFRFTLDGVAYPILRKAIGDIIRGRANGLSRVFLPTCAELMHYCDSLTTQAHGCIAQADRLLGAPEAQPVKRISPERAAELKKQMRLAVQKKEEVEG